MTTEKLIAEGVQDEIQSLSEFADGDVVINDWSLMDGERANAPYCIIRTSDDFEVRPVGKEPEADWEIPVGIWVEYLNWDSALNELRTVRQAILDHFTGENDAASAGGIEGLRLRAIYSMTPITPDYGVYIPPEYDAEALPDFLYQWMGFDFEEF